MKKLAQAHFKILIIYIYIYVTISPLAPEYVNFFQLFYFGDQLVVPIGALHISSWLQEIQSREWEERTKNKRRIWAWVNSKCKKRSYLTLHSLCICRLTIAWISSENSTTHEERWLILTGLPSLHLDSLSWDWSFRCPVSTSSATLRRPSPTAFSEFLCPAPHWRSLPTSGRVEISSPNPLSGFAPKQTKGSSAWRTTYMVSHTHTHTHIYIYIYIYIYVRKTHFNTTEDTGLPPQQLTIHFKISHLFAHS